MTSKKRISVWICKAALILCLNLFPAYSMMSEEPSSGSSPSLQIYKKGNNKEKYQLYKENFSSETEIDFVSLYKTIHYIFKNKELLVEALHPLLPPTLQRKEDAFEQLEFLGDSVLGLIIRERLLDLFPHEKRGMHCKLYDALICNKTLAEVYLNNLPIEAYVPYPGEKECEYCNIVEALIGAIYQDSQPNDLTQSRKFIMRILDDHVLIQKRAELIERMSLAIDTSETHVSFMLPILEKVIKEVFEDPQNHQANPKSLLGMILAKTLQDQPRYELSLGKNEAGLPVFMINVVGAQIGHKIQGIGFTRDEAEQDAARNAINFLAQDMRLSRKELNAPKKTYGEFIHNYCQAQGLTFSLKELSPLPNFICQAKLGEKIIGEETAQSKARAREEAARQAYVYLTKPQEIEAGGLGDKKYRSLLLEWVSKNHVSDFQLVETSSQSSVQFQVKIDGDLLGKGEGFPEEAKERAYQSIFEQLLKKQEEAHTEREARKISAKKVKQLPLIKLKAEVSSESLFLPQKERNGESVMLENSTPTLQKQKKHRKRKTKQAQQSIKTTTTTTSLTHTESSKNELL